MFEFKDYTDIRDVIDAYEKAEKEGDTEIIDQLKPILEELAGKGGDYQWRGEWYPIRMVHEDYFPEYIEETVKDCGFISRNIPWWIEIDWEKTAGYVACNYEKIDIDGSIYYCD